MIRFDAHKARKWQGIKIRKKSVYTKPDTMLLIMLGVFKDLQTAVNERVDDNVWVLKMCVGESVVMKIRGIHLGSHR